MTLNPALRLVSMPFLIHMIFTDGQSEMRQGDATSGGLTSERSQAIPTAQTQILPPKLGQLGYTLAQNIAVLQTAKILVSSLEKKWHVHPRLHFAWFSYCPVVMCAN